VPRITFVDEDGVEGVIESDMTLRYSGRFEDEIAEFANSAIGNGSSPSARAAQRLAIDLFAEFPLSEIEIDGKE
jgi:hypothetical protein